MSYLSIESWVQYVTVGHHCRFVSCGAQNVWGIFDVFSKRKKIWSKLNFPKISHLWFVWLFFLFLTTHTRLVPKNCLVNYKRKFSFVLWLWSCASRWQGCSSKPSPPSECPLFQTPSLLLSPQGWPKENGFFLSTVLVFIWSTVLISVIRNSHFPVFQLL